MFPCDILKFYIYTDGTHTHTRAHTDIHTLHCSALHLKFTYTFTFTLHLHYIIFTVIIYCIKCETHPWIKLQLLRPPTHSSMLVNLRSNSSNHRSNNHRSDILHCVRTGFWDMRLFFLFFSFCRVPLCCLLDKDTPPWSLLSLSHVEQKLSKMFGSQGLFNCCFRDNFFSCFMARSFVESKQRPFRYGAFDIPVR